MATQLINEAIENYNNSPLREKLAVDWSFPVSSLSIESLDEPTLTWFREFIGCEVEIAERRINKYHQSATEEAKKNHLMQVIEMALEEAWQAELASRCAPNDPEAQHWMLS